MTPARAPTPTRQNLLALQRRLARVAKGTALLRRKREALVAELFRLARPAATARASIAERARLAYPAVLDALSAEGYAGLRTLGLPPRQLTIEIREAQVWGISVAELLKHPTIPRTLAARGTPPPTASPVTAGAAATFEELVELLLDAANRESLLRRLGDALNRTSRQVNNLERRLGPELEAQRAGIRRTLDEREREEHLRLERLLSSKEA